MSPRDGSAVRPYPERAPTSRRRHGCTRARHRTARAAAALLCPLLALAVCAEGTAAAGPEAPALPLKGRRLVFRDEFDRLDLGRGRTWGWQTGAYPGCVTNGGDHKLDVLSPSALTVDRGVLSLTARRIDDGSWETGLLTTGDSCGTGGNGFLERTGDVIVAHVRLPGLQGGWPAIWSWRDGGNELDLLEWHTTHSHRLEFVNHVGATGHYWYSPVVRPGRWLWVAAHLGARSVTWYAGTSRAGMKAVWSDGKGVGRDFRAHPVISLSVEDGRYQAAPGPRSVPRFQVGSFTVYR